MGYSSLILLIASANCIALSNYEYSVSAPYSVDQIERVSFSDFCIPLSIETGYQNRCLLDVSSDECIWRLLIGGKDRLVLLEDGEIASEVHLEPPSQYGDYVVSPNLSPDQALVGYRNLSEEPLEMRLYSYEQGSYVQAIADRPSTIVGDVILSFWPLLCDDSVFFIDVAGFFGGYCDELGHVEYDYTGTGDQFSFGRLPISPPMNFAVSADGSLLVAAMQDTPRIVLGFSLTDGFLWKQVCNSLGGISISENALFVVIDRYEKGMQLLDGRTGQVLNSYLHNSSVVPSSLHISPNGRFVVASIEVENQLDCSPGTTCLARIDTRDSNPDQEYWYNSDLNLCNPCLINVADDGSFLLRDDEQYMVIGEDGNIVFTVSTEESFDSAEIASSESGYTFGMLDELAGEAVFVKLITDE